MVIANPVDVTGTVPSKFLKLRLVSQRPCLEHGGRVPLSVLSGRYIGFLLPNGLDHVSPKGHYGPTEEKCK